MADIESKMQNQYEGRLIVSQNIVEYIVID